MINVYHLLEYVNQVNKIEGGVRGWFRNSIRRQKGGDLEKIKLYCKICVQSTAIHLKNTKKFYILSSVYPMY